jgi:arylformamidase
MSGSSAELFEREYNLRAAFPDHPQWFARWAADSAAARGRLEASLDLRYGDGPKQTLDLFPCAESRATLLFIHGGYWRALDKSEHSFVAPPLVEQGIAVAVINYDLCPQVGIATIVAQCREAVVWLKREALHRRLATARFVVAGHSAGGHLTAMLLATDWQAHGLPADTLSAGVAVSGVFDLEPLVHVSFNADLKLDAGEARALSPIHVRPVVAAPLLIAAGADETSEFIRQSRLIWERWPECRPRGARTPLFVPDRHHFSVLCDLGDPKSELVRRMLALV